MKAPAFWQERGVLSTALLPLATLYDMASVLKRYYAKPVDVGVPVLCIGNLTAGGAGKTPVALHIGALLKERGINAFYVSRGYGGDHDEATLVDLRKHSATEVGDEPLLLAAILPTIVAKDRVSAAKIAVAKGATLIIMDDGFQNPALVKTASLLVINGAQGIGNGRILPAGPLRESVESGLKRANAVIAINPGHDSFLPEGTLVITAKTVPQTSAQALKGKRIIAFCGIAHPQKFADTLSILGADVVEQVNFPDHHHFRDAELKKLFKRAIDERAFLVTTAKDAVRIPVKLRSQLFVVEIALMFDKPEALTALLEYVMTA